MIALIVGSQYINKWGHNPAIRGEGVKVKCECCGVTVHKSGVKRHQGTASNASTNVEIEEIQHLMPQQVLVQINCHGTKRNHI